MGLQDKYKTLIDFANNSKVVNLSIKENKGVLYISGTTSLTTKEAMWNIYSQIDPDMRAGDLVMDIEEDGSEEIYEVKAGDNLSKIAKKYPNMTWQKIFDTNKKTIKDPNKIFPGQKNQNSSITIRHATRFPCGR